MSIKVVHIIANTNKSIAFELIANGLKQNKINISYILLQEGETEFSRYLKSIGIKYYIISLSGNINILKSFFKIFILLFRIKPCIVHTHLREANILGLTAAYLLFIKNRIYTRHHSTFNLEYFPHAVKWDKYTNKISTHIVSVSDVVTNVLIKMEGVESTKISKIPHGILINKFSNSRDKTFNPLYQKYNILSDKKPIIGVISRYIHLKGVQYVIPAFAEIKNEFPHAHLILANAVGNDSEEIKKILAQNLLSNSYTEIEFESDIYSLYNLFDVFIHTPINSNVEAFGQTYVEALAAGVPSVFTLSGIAPEFIENEKNALVVNYKSTSEIKDAIIQILTEPELRRKIVDNGFKSLSAFSSENYVINHVNLYKKLCPQKDKK